MNLEPLSRQYESCESALPNRQSSESLDYGICLPLQKALIPSTKELLLK